MGENLTWDQGVAGLSLTKGTVLCPSPQCSTDSTQEDPSRHKWRIVDRDVKNQIKQTYKVRETIGYRLLNWKGQNYGFNIKTWVARSQ